MTQSGYDTGELGAGFSRGLSNRFSVYGEVDYRFELGGGGTEVRGTSGSLGFRYWW
jgi:outer membrane autotransporter protein